MSEKGKKEHKKKKPTGGWTEVHRKFCMRNGGKKVRSMSNWNNSMVFCNDIQA